MGPNAGIKTNLDFLENHGFMDFSMLLNKKLLVFNFDTIFCVLSNLGITLCYFCTRDGEFGQINAL